MNIYEELVAHEVFPALGCTEPIAVAFAAAVAAAQLKGEVEEVRIEVDPGVFKNGFAVTVPNTGGEKGNLIAGALGALIARPELKMEILKGSDDNLLARHGELTNYSNIARDCGVDAKTVKEYYQILVDTLLGVMIEPYKRGQERQVITKAGKFYLFDVGVAGAITRRLVAHERGEEFGKAFEHFILMEILAHRSYKDLGYEVNFWRLKSGLEVDFVLGRGQVAIEVKGNSRIDNADLRPLKAFIQEYRPKKAFVVCNEIHPRVHEKIDILPWSHFLKMLWQGEVIS